MARRAWREPFAAAEVLPKAGGGRVAPTEVGGQRVWTHTNTQGWQTEAWEYEGLVGELRQALNWQASAASRAVIYPTERTDDGGPGAPTEDRRVIEATSILLDRLRQQGWLYTAAYNLSLTGTFYLYGAEFDGDAGYRVVSVEDVNREGARGVTVRVDDGKPRTYRRERETLDRIWWEYPRHPWQATSPIRSLLPLLCDIVKLTKLIGSVADSRMRGAGLLLLSSRLSLPGSSPDEPGPTVAQELLRVASTALQNPDSAEAHVPITMEGDLDAAEKVAELINLGVDFPKLLDQLLASAIKRLALALPIPSGIILGESANHWNEFHREDEAVKMVITPLVELIAAGLAQTWLPPIISSIGLDPARWTLGTDMSAVEQRPDKSARALEVYDRGALSDEALRRETGFDDDDAPESEGEDVDEQPPPEGPAPEEPRQPVGPPAGDGQGNPPPDALAAAAHVAAVAALARLGNKLRGSSHANRRAYSGLAAHTVHTVAQAAERERVNCDDWPDGVLEAYAAAAQAAGLDPECACYRLQAAVSQAFRNGAALGALPSIDFEACRSA